MLEELEIEGRDFEADSWSMVVDSAYLQTHRKDIIKRQDVIYGERERRKDTERERESVNQMCSNEIAIVLHYIMFLMKQHICSLYSHQVSSFSTVYKLKKDMIGAF